MTNESHRPSGIKDYAALALSTFGVGYIPGAPGTYGSIIGLAIYLFLGMHLAEAAEHGRSIGTQSAFISAFHFAVIAIVLAIFVFAGIWASGRSTEIFGTDDPHEAVVDEVMGQIITFLFIPFTMSWKLLLTGFILFRLFDIWKPYPINTLQQLPKGLGICADDILAAVYAGVCLSIIYAVTLM
ncbi:MAG TPA: phosphatidylglycerophosphatase A [Pyrinomonadaceae bacterium]|nr:phosphatidylglycerophosphatase A [Pyrinomonadaceae bacterium]